MKTRIVRSAVWIAALGVAVLGQEANAVKKSHIVIFDMKTKAQRVVFSADQLIEAPNWSPDGKRLLVNMGGELFFLPLDTANPALQKLNLGDFAKCNNDKGFSPDGKLIAFSSSAKSEGSQVFTVPSTGGTPELIVPETPSYFHGFSPDGKWLAVVAQRQQNFDLFRVPVGGGAQERLTSNAGYDDGPDYSPNGKWIYFNSDRSGSWDIWRMPADGAGPNDTKAQRVTTDEGEDWFPHPSPDGKTLIFLTFPKGTTGHNGRGPVQIRMVPMPRATVSATRPVELTSFIGGQGSINVNSWAPDSHAFAFVTYEQ